MLAGPAISGMASGKTAISLLRSASISSPVVSAERPPGWAKINSMQQEQDAGSNLERRHADLQELQKLRTANCEDDENSAGYRDGLDREPGSEAATDSRCKDSEDSCSLERADGDQKHHDCRSGKFDDPPHCSRSNPVSLRPVTSVTGRQSWRLSSDWVGSKATGGLPPYVFCVASIIPCKCAAAVSTSKCLYWPARLSAVRMAQRWAFSKSPYGNS